MPNYKVVIEVSYYVDSPNAGEARHYALGELNKSKVTWHESEVIAVINEDSGEDENA
jgi:hypothetical protein